MALDRGCHGLWAHGHMGHASVRVMDVCPMHLLWEKMCG